MQHSAHSQQDSSQGAKLLPVREYLRLTTHFFDTKNLDSPRLDAELLLAHVLKLDRLQLLLSSDRPLDEKERDLYRELVKQRADHVPVAYLCGAKSFYQHDFKVNKSVLIPRPETEILVDETLALLREKGLGSVLDVGTGSGCIAIALALAERKLQVNAIDICPRALSTAKENAENLGANVLFTESDMLSLSAESLEGIECIVSNPPYVSQQELSLMSKETVQHEPEIALYGTGDDGLGHIKALVRSADEAHVPLLMEVGYTQMDKVSSLSTPSLRFDRYVRDLDGNPRVAIFLPRSS